MKKLSVFLHIASVLFIIMSLADKASGQTSYIWTGAGVNNSWETAANWNPNGIPGTSSGDQVTISGGARTPELAVSRSVTGFTIAGNKTLDLKGFTLTVTGAATFTYGSVITTLGAASVMITSTTATATFGSDIASPVTFGSVSNQVNVKAVCARILVNGGVTINGTAEFEKTGATSDSWVSGNSFKGITRIKSSSGSIMCGNTGSGTDLFNTDLELTNTGTAQINIAGISTNTTTIHGIVSVFNSGTGSVTFAYSTGGTANPNHATINFNGKILLSNTSSGQISFGKNAANSNPSINISGSKPIKSTGFTGGQLYIRKVTQSGSVGTDGINDLQLSNTAALTIVSCSLNLGGTFSTPSISISGSVFSNTVTINKTGSSSDQLGDNTFNGTVSYSNSGTGSLSTGYNTSTEVYENDVTFSASAGAGFIYPSAQGATTYKGNITFNSASSNGIAFSNQGGTSVLTLGKLIVASGTFSSGNLTLKNVTQASSAVAGQNLVLDGTAGMVFNPGTVFSGALVVTTPNLYLNGAQFNNNSEFTKTSATANSSAGGNVFFKPVIIRLSAAAGKELWLQTNSPDQFKDNAYFYNESTQTDPLLTALLHVAYSTAVTTFDGNVLFENSGSGQIIVCQNTGSEVAFNNAKKVTINHAAIYSGATLIRTSTGSIHIPKSGKAAFDSNIEINNTSTAIPSTSFSYTPSGQTILSAGRTIAVGAQGFAGGILRLQNFQQLGNGTLQQLYVTNDGTLSGTGSAQLFILSNTTFAGNFKAIAPEITVTGPVTFGGTSDLTQTGSGSNKFSGTITFSGNASVTNGGSGYLYLGNSAGDVFNFLGNAVFTRGSSAVFAVARTGTTNFYGDVTYNSSNGSATSFGLAGGLVVFTGSSTQNINSVSPVAPTVPPLSFNRITVNKSANSVILNAAVNIVLQSTFIPELNLIQGNIVSTVTNCLNLPDNLTFTGGSSLSFVSGPINKKGDDAFTFHTGKAPVYAPIYMLAPASTSDAFRVEYLQGGAVSAPITSPLKDVSNCEYWDIQRTGGTSLVNFTLYWSPALCSPVNASIFSAARHNGTAWVDAGGAGLTGDDLSGSITTTVPLFQGPLTFGYKSLFLLDTKQVNPASFRITQGAEPLSAVTFTSGAAGTAAGTKTLVSNTNNTPGIIVLHPDLPAPVLGITIDPGQVNESMDVNAALDASSNITSVKAKFQGTFYDMASQYYSIESYSGASSKLLFMKQKAAAPLLNITTNLPDGVTFDISDLTTFQITIPAPGFTSYQLRILNSSGTNIYTSPGLSWNGLNGATPYPEGTYSFELDIVNGGITNTYTGQLILKY